MIPESILAVTFALMRTKGLSLGDELRERLGTDRADDGRA